MIRRFFSVTCQVFAWAILLLALVIPAIAVVIRCIEERFVPTGGFSWGSRQWVLLGRSALLAAGSAALCLVLAVPGAILVARRRRGITIFLFAASLAQMLCTPMVYAFGWERILPVHFNAYLRSMLISSLWAWPGPAAMMGLAYRRRGAAVFDLTRLETSKSRALLLGVIPLLGGTIAACFLVLFAVFLADPTIPHACALVVFSTELQGWATSSPRVVDTLWPAMMLMLPLMAILFCAYKLLRSDHLPEFPTTPPASTRNAKATIFVALLLAIGWVFPTGALFIKHGSWRSFSKTLQMYGQDIAWSFFCAIVAAVAVIFCAIAQAGRIRASRKFFWLAIAIGLMPGTVVGIGLVAAYNRIFTAWIYDYWTVVSLAYVSRFAWVGAWVGLALHNLFRSVVCSQARLDGADQLGITRHLVLTLMGPMLVIAGGVVIVLSLGEMSAAELVRVPGFQTISSLLVEKFHRFEDEILVALSIIPALGALAVVGCGAFASRWMANRHASF